MVSVHGGGLKAPLLVWAMAVAFLLLVASLLIGSFTRPEFPPYELGLHADSTYTLDASRGDQWRWWGGATSAFDATTSLPRPAPEPSIWVSYHSTPSRSSQPTGTSRPALPPTPPTRLSANGTSTACGRICSPQGITSMRSARRPASLPSSRSSPTTVAMWARPATRSATKHRAPGRLGRRGRASSRTAGLLGGGGWQDLEHSGPAHGANTL